MNTKDTLYYKTALQILLKQASDNGVDVYAKEINGEILVSIESDGYKKSTVKLPGAFNDLKTRQTKSVEFIDIHTDLRSCANPQESFGEICVRCNKCFKYGRK